MKLCIDCRFYKDLSFPASIFCASIPSHWCERDADIEQDPVTGRESMVGRKMCSDERHMKESWYCGPEGKFFEGKS